MRDNNHNISRPAMQTNNKTCFFALAQDKSGIWYALFNSYALLSGKVNKKQFDKFVILCKKLKIESCRIQVECDNGGIDISTKDGRNIFTIDEVREFIEPYQ